MPKQYANESWYLCLSCDTEYQLNDIIASYTELIECPNCSSHEYIINSSEDVDKYLNANSPTDYSTYDIYDSYY